MKGAFPRAGGGMWGAWEGASSRDRGQSLQPPPPLQGAFGLRLPPSPAPPALGVSDGISHPYTWLWPRTGWAGALLTAAAPSKPGFG